ncbi:diacylglycerol kinase family protein [Allomuricauda sp. NBRC 101325]|uniref:diacylglycerol/lipid kinase family protein n=1 Tax=Allomuricauda sp. NBRC 101325 TaxID=1113758 RepID=UPI0024A1F256|nr:diacylglycerol kinase family protein [Muricauda sp. NBRC 101325]GLU45167.1 hypothetical protein Musp01_27910 [Muricauda sp. NBRC 101325]
MGYQHIHFIVNPIAGKGTQRLQQEYLEQFFIKSYHQLTVKYTEYRAHATTLTMESLAQGADIIVACGGDGTINEVASCLLGTAVPLGIIPIGSGNGLASNLNIPKNLRQALALLRSPEIIAIDTGTVHDRFFFSNTGIGFDASVIKNYESSDRRTLIGYLKACLTSFRELKQPKETFVHLEDRTFKTYPFMVFVSNTNVMGYRMSLTPKASLQDGLLDVLVIAGINRFKMLLLGVLLLLNRPHWLKEAQHFQTTSLKLVREGSASHEVQIDGEFHTLEVPDIAIGLGQHALRVIVPQNGV